MKSTRARADRAKASAMKRGFMKHGFTKRSFDTKRLTTDAVLLAAALIIARLEALLPAFLVMPGFKPGLANIATLLTVRLCGRRDGFALTLLRVTITSVLFGSVTSFLFSLCGGVLSFVVTAALVGFTEKEDAKMSLVGVSVLASAAHNLGQTGAAYLVFGSLSPLGMLWWLFLLSAPTGLVTGIPAEIITRRLKPVIRPKGKE